MISFDKSIKKFDLKAARAQYDFIRSVDIHHTEMLEMEKQITSYEKQLDASTRNDDVSYSDSDDSGDGETRWPVNKTPQQLKDEKFVKLNDKLKKQVQDYVQQNNDSSLDILIQQLSNNMKEIN